MQTHIIAKMIGLIVELCISSDLQWFSSVSGLSNTRQIKNFIPLGIVLAIRLILHHEEGILVVARKQNRSWLGPSGSTQAFMPKTGHQGHPFQPRLY